MSYRSADLLALKKKTNPGCLLMVWPD